ncbi:MAG: pyridoxal phosphate-dependent aminotransferase [Acidobacteriota bacterium]
MSSKVRGAKRLTAFNDSIFPEMTRLAAGHAAVNLSQGFPDFAAPEPIKRAACDAILQDLNQYPLSHGTRSLREAVAERFLAKHGVKVDAEREVTVCCGSTEAMLATMLAVIDPGDEVIVFEPFYENYGPDAILAGATPVYVPLHPPAWALDVDRLAGAFSSRTRAIVINTPTNPTGKVFSREELGAIAELCHRWDAIAISDEIYEHIVFDGHVHMPIAALPGMADRTVTISGLSKTYSVTGWRIGWAIAPEALSAGIRKMHEYITVAAPAPLQEAGARALALPDGYYRDMAGQYQRLRDWLVGILDRQGFVCYPPAGAYYVMADISRFGFEDDVAFARYLVSEIGVAAIPASSFYQDARHGASLVRFCFSKRDETIREAELRLARLRAAKP